jgi:hypothetical protein
MRQENAGGIMENIRGELKIGKNGQIWEENDQQGRGVPRSGFVGIVGNCPARNGKRPEQIGQNVWRGEGLATEEERERMEEPKKWRKILQKNGSSKQIQ